MSQISFNDTPKVISPNEPHMPLIFLLDTSGSMEGDPIDELNKGLKRFKNEVTKDEKTKRILDVAMIEFNINYSVLQPFTPISYLDPITLNAKGSTYISGAVNEAIKMLNERVKFYHSAGVEIYKPWIVLISDGKPFDVDDSLINKVNNLVEKNKLAFWSLAVKGADKELLHKLSGKRVLNLEDYDFSKFFDWVNKSMRAISVSTPSEKAKGQELPDNITIDDLM